MKTKGHYIHKNEIMKQLDILISRVEQLETITKTTHPFIKQASHDKITKKSNLIGKGE